MRVATNSSVASMTLAVWLASSAFTGASAQALGGNDWEPIAEDYRNVRGLNYLSVYPALNVQGAVYNGIEWKGVTSSTAMWEYYDTAPNGTSITVDQQLRELKDIGVNTIRVFLSYPAWEHYRGVGGNEFLRRFDHFLGLCDANRIWCIPVLWDNTGAGANNPPDLEDYYSKSNLWGWHSNPGEGVVVNTVTSSGGFAASLQAEYVKEVAQVADQHDSFLAWDLFNEAAIVWPFLGPFLDGTLGVLQGFPEHPTILSLIWSDPDPWARSLMTDHRVDIHSVHSYSHSLDYLRSIVYDASHIEIVLGGGPGQLHPPKHVISTEIGSSGAGYNYGDAVRDANLVRRDALGPGELGMGFMSFVSHMGWRYSRRPYLLESGIFYGDGEIRDLSVADAFIAAAIDDGFVPNGIPGLVQKAPSDPDYIPQLPVSQRFDNLNEQFFLMQMPNYLFADVVGDMQEYAEVRGLFSYMASLQIGLPSLFASTTNGNPYGSANPPVGSVPPLQTFVDIANWLNTTQLTSTGDPLAPYVPTFFTTLIETISGQAPFDPLNNALHLDMLSIMSLAPLRDYLAPYVLLQNDNSDS